MKYYHEQKTGDGSEWIFAEQEYLHYIQTIKDALPPDLRLLWDRTSGWSPDRIYLNDSNIKSIAADFGDKSVQIVLLGKTLNENIHQIGERRFTLQYGQVQRLTCRGEYGDNPPFAMLHGDHILDEVELLGPSLYEHRMLFASDGDIELTLVFGEFRLTFMDTLR